MCTLEDRLFTPAVDVAAVSLHYVCGRGWSASIAHRHSGEEWALCGVERYEALTAAEVLDVVSAGLSLLLE